VGTSLRHRRLPAAVVVSIRLRLDAEVDDAHQGGRLTIAWHDSSGHLAPVLMTGQPQPFSRGEASADLA
jgi:diaminopimelate epimerase